MTTSTDDSMRTIRQTQALLKAGLAGWKQPARPKRYIALCGPTPRDVQFLRTAAGTAELVADYDQATRFTSAQAAERATEQWRALAGAPADAIALWQDD